MRTYHKPEPKTGDRRHVRQFIIIPKRIGDETRWLERATWAEQYIEYLRASTVGTVRVRGWVPIEWINK